MKKQTFGGFGKKSIIGKITLGETDMKLLSLLAVVVITFVPVALHAADTLTVIYTGGLQGELEPCGCSPGANKGGMPRLSGYILDNREKLSPYIIVDAGNFTGEDSPQGRLKAEAMIKAFRAMRYDAVLFGENERKFPKDFFVPLIREKRIPFVSTSFPCKASVSFERNGMNIHVSADPEDTAPDSLNILLTDRSIADAVGLKGWDVVISSSGEKLKEPIMTSSTIIASSYPRGESVGILGLEFNEEGKIARFTHRWQELGPDIEEDPLIRKIIDEYDAKVAELLDRTVPASDGSTYSGVEGCGLCHQLFVESWQKTRHARAFESLKKVGKERDPECLVCHTVGFLKEGGFHSIETTPGLANVQCESCHGLHPEHVEDFSAPLPDVGREVCLGCHTGENSPEFNYETYLEKIKH
jgi:hypothetical protein